jgi:hypothetical protein
VSNLGQLLCDLLNPGAGQPSDQRIAQYSPTFRLAFSLLNEDFMTNGHRGWAIEKNLASKPHLITCHFGIFWTIFNQKFTQA